MTRPIRARHDSSAKLAVDDAINIRARYAAGASVRALAAEHAVSLAAVYAALRGQSHRCVVRIELPDAVFAVLTARARETGRTREEVAATLVAAALAPRAT